MAVIHGPKSMSQRGEEITLRFPTYQDAVKFFNAHTVAPAKKD